MKGNGMNRQPLPRQMMVLTVLLFRLVGCAGSPRVTPGPTPQSAPTLVPTPRPSPAPRPVHTPTPTSMLMTATPDPCVGWRCTLRGVVYVDAASSGNESAGTLVELTHVSWCSPTSGQHATTTGPDGGFGFEVFVHDTDTFWIQVEQDGYESVRRSVGGFDCLSCACPLVEIVLESLGAFTTAPQGRNTSASPTRASGPA